MRPGDGVIRTERLELSPLREDDATEMAVVLGDERLHEFTGGSPASADQLRDRFRRLAAGSGRPDQTWLNWIVRLAATGEAVGTVQATVTADGDRRTASVAWVIGVPWQDAGFASEAATALVAWLSGACGPGAAAITASIHPRHHASERVAGRAGLVSTDREGDGERVWELVISEPGS
jgi:RimJ/RimL family protein N-acetyltransferase